MTTSKLGVSFLLGTLLIVAMPNSAEASFLSAISKLFKGADEAAPATKSADEVATSAINNAEDATQAVKSTENASAEMSQTPEEVSSMLVPLVDETNSSLKPKPEEEIIPNAASSETVEASKSAEVLEVSKDLALEVITICVENCPIEEKENRSASDDTTPDNSR